MDEIDKRHVPYDVIGLSMYTYWNGPISALKANMDDISKRYNKDVIVVEAAYAYTLANCDNAENSFQAKEERMGISRQRTRGNINYIHDLMQAVVDVPDQRGKVFSIGSLHGFAVPGNTWATPAGMEIYPRRVEKRVMHVKIRRYLIARESIAVGKSF